MTPDDAVLKALGVHRRAGPDDLPPCAWDLASEAGLPLRTVEAALRRLRADLQVEASEHWCGGVGTVERWRLVTPEERRRVLDEAALRFRWGRGDVTILPRGEVPSSSPAGSRPAR